MMLLRFYGLLFFSLVISGAQPVCAYGSGNTMIIRHRAKSKKVPLLQRKFVFMKEEDSSSFIPASGSQGVSPSYSQESYKQTDTKGISSLSKSLTKKQPVVIKKVSKSPAPRKVLKRTTKNLGSVAGKPIQANQDPYDDTNWSDFMVEEADNSYGESLNVNAKLLN